MSFYQPSCSCPSCASTASQPYGFAPYTPFSSAPFQQPGAFGMTAGAGIPFPEGYPYYEEPQGYGPFSNSYAPQSFESAFDQPCDGPCCNGNRPETMEIPMFGFPAQQGCGGECCNGQVIDHVVNQHEYNMARERERSRTRVSPGRSRSRGRRGAGGRGGRRRHYETYGNGCGMM